MVKLRHVKDIFRLLYRFSVSTITWKVRSQLDSSRIHLLIHCSSQDSKVSGSPRCFANAEFGQLNHLPAYSLVPISVTEY